MRPSDSITTDVLIEAPIERVWTLVTSAEHLGRWFADGGAEVDLRPGGALALTWRDAGTVRGRVEALEPPRRFAFRWLTSFRVDEEPTPANSTLAEFTLAPVGDGTRVTVTERGFDGLRVDADARAALLADHTAGWRAELDDLLGHAGAAGEPA